jgi:uncharacterized protein (TIGR02246 family)
MSELPRRKEMNQMPTGLQKLLVLVALTVAAFTVVAQEAKTPKMQAEDDAAIRENVKQMESGWNTKSGATYARPFAKDADFVVINGTHVQGHEAIEKGSQRIFDTIFKNTTVSLTVKQIRFLRPDVAVVHVSGHRDAPEAERLNAMIVLVMTKEGGQWKIASFQNTEVTGPPPSK